MLQNERESERELEILENQLRELEEMEENLRKKQLIEDIKNELIVCMVKLLVSGSGVDSISAVERKQFERQTRCLNNLIRKIIYRPK